MKLSFEFFHKTPLFYAIYEPNLQIDIFKTLLQGNKIDFNCKSIFKQ